MLTRGSINSLACFAQGGGNARRKACATGLAGQSADVEMPESVEEKKEELADEAEQGTAPETPSTETPVEKPEESGKRRKKDKKKILAYVLVGAAILWLAWVFFVKKR